MAAEIDEILSEKEKEEEKADKVAEGARANDSGNDCDSDTPINVDPPNAAVIERPEEEKKAEPGEQRLIETAN